VTRQSLYPLFDWFEHSLLGRTMSNSSVLIALAQIVHLLGMTLLIGTILTVDLTLLGFGMRRYSAARVAGDLAPWTSIGLAIVLLSGPLVLSSEALKCYDASFFWIKMAVLAAALLFHFTVHRRVALAEPPVSPFRAGMVACVSLSLWVGVALAAKFIGIFGDNLRDKASLF
jgi:hypothetical protein